MNPDNEIHISAQITPNPNSLQFYADRILVAEGAYNFTDAAKAEGSGLPAVLFELPEVDSVMVGKEFVTVTKKDDAAWPALVEVVIERIKQYLAEGKPAIEPAKLQGMQEAEASGPSDDISVQIKKIIDDEIRPAVARDGGDIIFDSFEDGVVRLHLRGACSSCPSSTYTLKMGIENRLKQAIPEVKEVISV